MELASFFPFPPLALRGPGSHPATTFDRPPVPGAEAATSGAESAAEPDVAPAPSKPPTRAVRPRRPAEEVRPRAVQRRPPFAARVLPFVPFNRPSHGCHPPRCLHSTATAAWARTAILATRPKLRRRSRAASSSLAAAAAKQRAPRPSRPLTRRATRRRRSCPPSRGSRSRPRAGRCRPLAFTLFPALARRATTASPALRSSSPAASKASASGAAPFHLFFV